MSKSYLTRFCVELDSLRFTKLKVHIARKHRTARKFIETIVDNIAQVQKALDATTFNGKKKLK